ncbi:general substrate transporter, partial [Xylariales sp. PMI_506]
IAVVTSSEETHSIWKCFQQNRRLSLWTIALASCSLVRGYETTFVGSISGLPAFLVAFGVPDDTNDGSYIIPSVWLSLWSASSSIGSLVGSLVGGWSQDTIGRRWTILISAVFQTAAVTISYLADHATTTAGRGAVYFVGKTAQGVAMGAIMCTAQAYISEILPPLIHDSIVSMIAPFSVLGQILAALVLKSQVQSLSPSAYRVPMATQWVFSIIPLLVGILLPESPAWLMRKQRWDDARAACLRLESPAAAAAAALATGTGCYDRIRANVVHDNEKYAGAGVDEKISYRELFRTRSNARRTLIAVFAGTVPQLFGLPLFGHTIYFAELLGLSAGAASTVFIAGALAGLLFSFVGFYLLTRVGRRRMLVIPMMTITVLWASMGIASFFDSPAVAWYVVGVIIVNLCFASGGAWPASYAVIGETSTLRLRARTVGLAWFANYLCDGAFSIVLPYLYNPDAANLGGKIGLVYAGISGIGTIGSWLWVPEMKERTPAELDELFEMGTSVRKF